MRTRWRLLVAVVCCVTGLSAGAQTQPSLSSNTILVVGDSLSAQYGIKSGSGWVPIVAEKLRAGQFNYDISNASISGDTSSGGVSRLPEALKRSKPGIVIIELGSNDALRGLSLVQMEKNLSTMIELSKKSGARVLLIGMHMPPNFGRQYTEQFSKVFSTLAEKYQTGLVPFFLEGIAADKQYFQADAIHPNEEGQPFMANNVWAQLKPMLCGTSSTSKPATPACHTATSL